MIEELGESARLIAFIGADTSKKRLFEEAYMPTHRAIIMEFFSMFVYRPREVGVTVLF
jgi:hypothetical protein